MKKLAIVFMVMAFGCSANKTFTNSAEKTFFPMEIGEEFTYRYVNSPSFVKYRDLGLLREFNGKTYHARQNHYSWDKIDTSYFRAENETIYYFDTKSGKESVQMPGKLKKGYSWTSADEAWSYEITDLDAQLTTPEQRYSGLLVIKSTQLQNRDRTKSPEYLIYYQQNVGKVASVTNGELMTYKVESQYP
ncbi:hypothetical protein [Litoribacter populi]|uniref:hypothetical protein n=1 Tax=Litoribacter populi TaxID=2598460 RepID=UPI00117E500F|nr:hypothetical protein [Litoribacter populi]